MQVCKFGGTSMADHRTWMRVADLLRTMEKPVVVVSATARTTRELVRAAELAARGEMGQALTMIRGIRERHIEIVRSFADEAGTLREGISSRETTSLRGDTAPNEASSWHKATLPHETSSSHKTTSSQETTSSHEANPSSSAKPAGESPGRPANTIDIDPAIHYIESIAEGLREDLDQVASTGSLTADTLDRIAGSGELLSSRLFAECARWIGLPAQFADARTIIKTDAVFGAANPDEARSADTINPIKTMLADGQIPVIGGYIGEAPDGRPTTLGFEGSDVTATFLGGLLGADSVTIWTDVDGIYSCDPRVVPDARRLESLTFAQAETLATCGAKVLHPNTLKPVSGRGIPVWVRNLFAPERGGTLISGYSSDGFLPGESSTAPRSGPAALAFREEVRVDGNARLPGLRISVMGLPSMRWDRVRDHAARVAEDFQYSEADEFLSAWIPEDESENRIQILYHLTCS